MYVFLIVRMDTGYTQYSRLLGAVVAARKCRPSGAQPQTTQHLFSRGESKGLTNNNILWLFRPLDSPLEKIKRFDHTGPFFRASKKKRKLNGITQWKVIIINNNNNNNSISLLIYIYIYCIYIYMYVMAIYGKSKKKKEHRSCPKIPVLGFENDYGFPSRGAPCGERPSTSCRNRHVEFAMYREYVYYIYICMYLYIWHTHIYIYDVYVFEKVGKKWKRWNPIWRNEYLY